MEESWPPLTTVLAMSSLQDTELVSTSLRTLTERLRELAQCTETVVLEGSPGGTTPQPPLIALLTCVVDLIGAAKRLFSWLNRSGAGKGHPWVLCIHSLVLSSQTSLPDTSSPP